MKNFSLFICKYKFFSMFFLKRLLKYFKFKLLEDYNFKNFYFAFKNNKLFYLFYLLKFIYRFILIKLTFAKTENIHVMLYGFNKYNFEFIVNLMMRYIFEGKKYEIITINKDNNQIFNYKKKGLIIFSECPLDFFKSKYNFFNAPLNWSVYVFIFKNDPRELVNLKLKNLPHINYICPDYSIENEPNYSFTGLGIYKIFNITQFLNNYFQNKIMQIDQNINPYIIEKNDENILRNLKYDLMKIIKKYDIPLLPITDKQINVTNKKLNNKLLDKKSWFDNYKNLENLIRISRVFPELEHFSIRLGYQSIDKLVDLNKLDFLKKNNPIIDGHVIAFYTNNEPYITEAKILVKSLERLNLKYKLIKYEPFKSWEENCALKPLFIKKMRDEIDGPLLYVDVDAIIHFSPWQYLHKYNCDIAVHISKKGNLHSGTILINDTQGARNVIEKWINYQNSNPLIWDQITLFDVIKSEEDQKSNNFFCDRLPINLIYVFDDIPPYIYGKKYIEHFQISREIKKDHYLKSKKGRRALKRRLKYKNNIS